MAKTYTLTDVAELLVVDPKSLRRWIEIEKWNLEQQTTKYDKRIKYLTEEQVKHLATVHERVWPPLPKATTQQQVAVTPGAVKLLEERVETLESLTGQINEQSRLLADAHIRIASLERAAANQNEQITRLVILANEQAAQIAALQTTPTRGKRTTQAQTDTGDTTELEPGLVSASAFAQLHSVNVTTAKSAYQSGRIPVRRGAWKHDGAAIQVALDDQGRARFYELYHNHADFQPCPDCPHTT